MSRILKLLTVVLLSSCCTGKIQQIQNPITEREYQILGKNCDYVFEKCKNRNNDYEIVNLLKYTECFNGLASDEMISILGSPTPKESAAPRAELPTCHARKCSAPYWGVSADGNGNFDLSQS